MSRNRPSGMDDLFSYGHVPTSFMSGPFPPVAYPDRPGWREPVTSKAAADSIVESAASLRGKVLASLRGAPATVHEMAARLERAVSSVQPRFSELRADGKIEPAGEQRRNETSGKSAHVWRVTR